MPPLSPPRMWSTYLCLHPFPITVVSIHTHTLPAPPEYPPACHAATSQTAAWLHLARGWNGSGHRKCKWCETACAHACALALAHGRLQVDRATSLGLPIHFNSILIGKLSVNMVALVCSLWCAFNACNRKHNSVLGVKEGLCVCLWT